MEKELRALVGCNVIVLAEHANIYGILTGSHGLYRVRVEGKVDTDYATCSFRADHVTLICNHDIWLRKISGRKG